MYTIRWAFGRAGIKIPRAENEGDQGYEAKIEGEEFHGRIFVLSFSFWPAIKSNPASLAP